MSTFDLNNRGQVSFAGSLDTDNDGQIDATGLFVWSHGSLKLVARTGTQIPGVGTVVQLAPPSFVQSGAFAGSGSFPGGTNNKRGQVLFTAAVDNGTGQLQGVLLLATPSEDEEEDTSPSPGPQSMSKDPVSPSHSAAVDQVLTNFRDDLIADSLLE